jgi:hypothetical protein
MTDKATIAAEIEALAGGNYQIWRIGLTNDPLVHKKQLRDVHKHDVSRWQQWQAPTLADARALEAKFVQFGMKSGAGGSVTDVFPTYLYVF